MTSESLNLRHLRVGPQLLTMLQQQTTLQCLALGPNFTQSVTLDTIVQSLPSNLAVLDLDVYRLSERRRTSCAGRLSGPEVDWQHELQKLWEGLPLGLVKLCLRFGRTDKTGILALARTLRCPENNRLVWLETLDLRNNQMDNEGAMAMAAAVAASSLNTNTNTNIQHLILSCNGIGSQGATALAESLNSTKLQSLDLSHNAAIDNVAVASFCEALKTNTHLKELNLYGCMGIDNIGIAALVDCLKVHNVTLERVHLTTKPPPRHNHENDDDGHVTTCAEQEQEERKALIQELEYWLSLNRAGRYLVHKGRQWQEPLGLWPMVFAKKPKPNSVHTFQGPHELFFLLKQNPGLFDKSMA